MDTPAEKGTKERIQEWDAQKRRILEMGGAKAIEDRHAKGQMLSLIHI